MSEEIAAADALLRENARLQTDLAGLRASLAQAQRATEAERAARGQAEADAAWWHATVANYVTSATVEDRALLRATLAEATTYPHPGAALLAELTAARAVVAVARREQKIAAALWTRPGEDTIALSDFEIALDAALRAYDEAVKARGE